MILHLFEKQCDTYLKVSGGLIYGYIIGLCKVNGSETQLLCTTIQLYTYICIDILYI